MKYEIQSRNDFMTGSYLVIQIPENELDQNALYTIQADCPNFILPFHYKSTNGQIELTYKIGAQSKLQYFSGDFTSKEYSELWQSLLRPLLECGDWFMDPCSFVLCADYLYYDKNKKIVSYVYIPSLGGCTSYDAFHEMAIEVSKMMTVSDAVLENKVLRSIIDNFNPIEFLKMLKNHLSEYEEPVMPQLPVSQPSVSVSSVSASSVSASFASQSSVFQPTLPEESSEDIKGATQSISNLINGSGLRFVGRGNLPQFIQASVGVGEIFTIGRFDATVGKKQSSFEFDKKTKAISRRHAVIEHSADGYKIVDLSSSAGTFVNDKKLPPNTPYELVSGCRVSFGNSGADYVWETN
ncbi:MAG: FHA domain-containing protein [Oscillospiraceae bacterium]|jgi:hypothetical protein|nr:FHA domain-containing protein [Oscillospiraceae bacterium]